VTEKQLLIDDRPARSAEVILRPRTIAVVGASERPGPGRNVVANLAQLRFPGETYLVNPGRASIDGRPTFRSLDALPAVPDLVVVAVNRDASVDALALAAALGVPAAVLLAAGFGEADAHGLELDHRLRDAARGMALMGPNCLGFVNMEDRVGAYSGPMMEQEGCGSVALVSQSGAMACTLTGAAAERRLRFSHVITTGNQIGLTSADYVRYLTGSEAVRVIACYLEGFDDGRGLVAAFAEARDAGKLVVSLKSGRSKAGTEAALSHTGALAGRAAIQEEVFERSGVRVAADVEELLALIELGDRLGPLRRGRVGVVTISGGERLLVADAAEAAGIELAPLAPLTQARIREALPSYAVVANPLDTTGAGIVEGDSAAHDEAALALAADPNVEIIVACQDAKNGWLEAVGTSTLFAGAVGAALRAAETTGKPLIVFSPTTGTVDRVARNLLVARGVPLVCGLRTAFSALAKLFGGAVPAVSDRRDAANVDSGVSISGYDAVVRLEAAGVPVWPTRRAATEDEAAQWSNELGYPVALKLDGRGLAHRTELGGVTLGLGDEPAVRAAWRLLVQRGEAAGVDEPATLVQAMAPSGVELFVGGFRDEQFGPVLLLGLGGTAVELLVDPVSALAPVEPPDVLDLLGREPFRSMLAGWRGAPPSDLVALAETVAALSRFVARDDVASLDVNPLIALVDGVALVDAKLELAGGGRP
jgi:acetate---CoA ligase (ADP-forming)